LDIGPQFAICVSKQELAGASLLQVLHLHSDGRCAGK